MEKLSKTEGRLGKQLREKDIVTLINKQDKSKLLKAKITNTYETQDKQHYVVLEDDKGNSQHINITQALNTNRLDEGSHILFFNGLILSRYLEQSNPELALTDFMVSNTKDDNETEAQISKEHIEQATKQREARREQECKNNLDRVEEENPKIIKDINVKSASVGIDGKISLDGYFRIANSLSSCIHNISKNKEFSNSEKKEATIKALDDAKKIVNTESKTVSARDFFGNIQNTMDRVAKNINEARTVNTSSDEKEKLLNDFWKMIISVDLAGDNRNEFSAFTLLLKDFEPPKPKTHMVKVTEITEKISFIKVISLDPEDARVKVSTFMRDLRNNNRELSTPTHIIKSLRVE